MVIPHDDYMCDGDYGDGGDADDDGHDDDFDDYETPYLTGTRTSAFTFICMMVIMVVLIMIMLITTMLIMTMLIMVVLIGMPMMMTPYLTGTRRIYFHLNSGLQQLLHFPDLDHDEDEKVSSMSKRLIV